MSGFMFDCPQYIDFTKPDCEADALDDFFDSSAKPIKQEQCSHQETTPVTPKDSLVVEDKKPHRSASLRQTPSSGSASRKSTTSNGPASRKRTTSNGPVSRKQTPSSGPVTRTHSSLEHSKKPSGKLHRSASFDRSKGATAAASNSENATARQTPLETAYATRLKITRPTTPSFMKRDTKTQAVAPAVSSEQLEMRKIHELRQQLARSRKMAGESLRMAQAAPGPVRATVHHVTKTEQFHFATDSRVKDHTMETRLDARQQDFPGSLRGPTDQTCETRRSDSANGTGKKRKRDLSGTKKATVPESPNLETRSRKRHHNIVSQAEIDDMEVEELKKHKIKAHPVNKRILKSRGIQKPAKKEPTRPMGVRLETERRLLTRPNTSQEDSVKEYEFHAKPVPTAILQHPVGVGQPKPHKLTVAQSPAFALKNRLRTFTNRVPSPPKESQHHSHVHPVPHVGIPFQPKLQHQATEIQPFSFESRDKLRAAEKAEKIKQVHKEDKKKCEFTAGLLPVGSPELPPKVIRPPTKLVPFELEVDLRGAKKAEVWGCKMEGELKQQRDNAKFKAHSSDVIHKPPFVPAKSSKPLTEVLDFELNTETRRDRRAGWEQFLRERCDEVDRFKEVAQAVQEEESREELEQLRAQTLFTHNEVRHYKPVVIKPSGQAVTVPKTPKFSERLNPYLRH